LPPAGLTARNWVERPKLPRIANSIYTALDTNPAETSHALLDRLTRLDQARKALEQELIREQDGQDAEVHRAHQHLLRVMDQVGLTVTF